MHRTGPGLRMSLYLLLVGVVAALPAFAGSAVIGSVAGSLNASIGGQAVMPNTTIFSGDSLQIKDGAAVVAIGGGSRMAFGRDTEASFLRESNQVTVLLNQGNVSLYHPEDGGVLQVKVGDLSILPAEGFKTLGDVAMVSGAVVVTAKEGMLRVEGNGSAVEIVKGKTLTVPTRAARSPNPAPAGTAFSSATLWSLASLAGSVTSSVLSGIAISRAANASDSANAAGAAADAAKAAADAAKAAASAAQATAVAAGCALNTLSNNLGIASPFTPPPGTSCN